MRTLDAAHWAALRSAAKAQDLSRLHVRRDWLVALLVGRCYLDISEVKAVRAAQLDVYGRSLAPPSVEPFRLRLMQSIRPRLVWLDTETHRNARLFADSLARRGKRLHDRDAAIRGCRWPYPQVTSRTLEHGFQALAETAGLAWSLSELRTRALANLARRGSRSQFVELTGLHVRAYYRHARAVNWRT